LWLGGEHAYKRRVGKDRSLRQSLATGLFLAAQ
jgi:hypothetical protein